MIYLKLQSSLEVVQHNMKLFAIIVHLSLIYFCPNCFADQVECFCTTVECQARNSTWCLTSALCYTQWLDRRDGSTPVYRGCMKPGLSATLLCLNQKPSLSNSVALWPQLDCCRTNRCNENVSEHMANSANHGHNIPVTSSSLATIPRSSTGPGAGSTDTILSVNRTTLPLTALERESLRKYGVTSVEGLRRKFRVSLAALKSAPFLSVMQLFVLATGVLMTLTISSFGYCILKYKSFDKKSFAFVDQREKASSSCADAESPPMYSSLICAEYKAIPQSLPSDV